MGATQSKNGLQATFAAAAIIAQDALPFWNVTAYGDGERAQFCIRSRLTGMGYWIAFPCDHIATRSAPVIAQAVLELFHSGSAKRKRSR